MERKERLQKIIAGSGICSRRKAEELILAGKVFVNGNKITELGIKASENDIIEIDSKVLKLASKKIYILLNKPIGYVTTASDEKGRATALDLVQGEIEERLFPVGRLDINTSGALILTNDGDFTNKITHPKNKIEKTYEVTLNREIAENEIKKLENGVIIAVEGEQFKTSPCSITPINGKKLHLMIHEGKNRQIRKMFESIGLKVIELRRIKIGSILLGNLPIGRFRHLAKSEINSFKSMKHF